MNEEISSYKQGCLSFLFLLWCQINAGNFWRSYERKCMTTHEDYEPCTLFRYSIRSVKIAVFWPPSSTFPKVTISHPGWIIKRKDRHITCWWFCIWWPYAAFACVWCIRHYRLGWGSVAESELVMWRSSHQRTQSPRAPQTETQSIKSLSFNPGKSDHLNSQSFFLQSGRRVPCSWNRM